MKNGGIKDFFKPLKEKNTINNEIKEPVKRVPYVDFIEQLSGDSTDKSDVQDFTSKLVQRSTSPKCSPIQNRTPRRRKRPPPVVVQVDTDDDNTTRRRSSRIKKIEYEKQEESSTEKAVDENVAEEVVNSDHQREKQEKMDSVKLPSQRKKTNQSTTTKKRKRKIKKNGKSKKHRYRTGYIFSSDSASSSSDELTDTSDSDSDVQITEVRQICLPAALPLSSSEESDIEIVDEPNNDDFNFDVEQLTKERSQSDLIIEDGRIEEIILELEKLNSSINVRDHWNTLSNKIGSEGENVQYTKLYEPTKLSEFICAREDSEPVQKVSSWMYHWRTVADRRKNIDARGEECSDDSYDGNDEPVTRALFLYGRSGVGKSSLVYSCAQEYNFRVIEVHAGQDRNGQILKETLHEATQSERLKKNKPNHDIQNFFKTANKVEPELTAGPVLDSLILFSGVDLLFNQSDEGFWLALKKFTDNTKVPIIFTANTLEANTGLNPEKEDINLTEKCTEIHLSRLNTEDVISMIRMVALNQGVDLGQEKATQLANYSNSYRQCLMNLQLWLNGYPKEDDKGPVEALNGLSSSLQDLNLDIANISEIESFYNSGINIVSTNRWRLLPNSTAKKYKPDVMVNARQLEKPSAKNTDNENMDELKGAARYTSIMSHFDRRSTVEQEVWTSPKCDVLLDAHPHSLMDPATMTPGRHNQIRCWAEMMALQTFPASNESFGVLSGEEDICFDRALPTHSAIASGSLLDRMVSEHNEIDGLTWGTNGNYSNYTLGSRFGSDVLPVMRELARESESKFLKDSRGNRRRGQIRYLDEIGFYLDVTDHSKLAESFMYQ